jgi:sec-independent protein translocase protein TatC
LLPSEQRTIRGVVFICSSLFFLGVCFGYFILAPFSISFLAGYTVEGAEVAPTLDSYVNYMTMFTIPTGLIFEMPIVAYFLAKLGVIGQQFMRAYRRHAIVVIVIVAAIITPPDVASQIIVVIPLLTLYEVSIMVVGRVQRQREKKLAASGYSNDVINPE